MQGLSASESVVGEGEIPVLEDEGESLTLTGPILLHLSDRYGRFVGTGEAQRREVLRWLLWGNRKLSAHMATYGLMRTFSRTADPAVLKYLRTRIDDFLGIVEQQVEARPFVIGDQATAADPSVCAYLSYPADETGYDLATSHPRVDAWPDRDPAWAEGSPRPLA